MHAHDLRRTSTYLRRRLPSALVDDVAQSAALEAWLARDRASHEGFVLGIARHEAADALRRERRERRREAAMAEIATADVGPVADATAQLAEIVDFVERRPELVAPLRWIVEELCGTSYEEIGKREGLPPATIRKRVSRLRRALVVAFAAALLALTGYALHAPRPAPMPAVAPAPTSLDGAYLVVGVESSDPRLRLLIGSTLTVRGDEITLRSLLDRSTTFHVSRAGDHVIVNDGAEPRAVDVRSAADGTLELSSQLGTMKLRPVH